ncbi:atypical membrane-integrating protein (Mistic protein) [Virgibacillus necropolis]|uniref:atypical membrane-integrating protein (Mistic protein) n=1 Tax=Virgibacillus necropolis TaxID=163877 RepID=UPI00384ABF34
MRTKRALIIEKGMLFFFFTNWVIQMKANENDYKKYSDAIDQIQQGNDAMIDLFNEMEGDRELISFDDKVVDQIEKAKVKFGNDAVNEKINTVVREMLSWLDLEDVD